ELKLTVFSSEEVETHAGEMAMITHLRNARYTHTHTHHKPQHQQPHTHTREHTPTHTHTHTHTHRHTHITPRPPPVYSPALGQTVQVPQSKDLSEGQFFIRSLNSNMH